MLSTLHTNNAVGAITRFLDMGVPDYLLASSMLAVTAQRLVRRLCPDCRQPAPVPAHFAERFALPAGQTVFEAAGCSKCAQTGFRGRIPIAEFKAVNPQMRTAIVQHPSIDELEAAAAHTDPGRPARRRHPQGAGRRYHLRGGHPHRRLTLSGRCAAIVMPEFHYTALSKTGGEVQGLEFADSAEALKTLLKKRRLILVKAKARKASRVAKGTVARLIAELADLAESDVVLERALQVLSEDRRDPTVSSLSSVLREELKSGNSLSQAFAKLGRIDPLVAPMLRAGEATGQLAGMLRRLSDHFEQANDLRREVRASLAYPSILLVVSLLSLIGLALYVVPVFRELFEDNLADLPVGTRIVFGISDWLVQNGTLAFGVSAAVLITLLLGFRHVPPLRDLAHRSMFALPLFGEIAALRQSASLTGVLGVLLSSGVPLVQAMQIAGETATNRYMRKLLARAHSERPPRAHPSPVP